MNLDTYLRDLRRWRTYTERDLESAANGVILAADGKLSRADAKMYAKYALEELGFERARDSRSKPVRAETVKQGSVHESGGAGTAIAQRRDQ